MTDEGIKIEIIRYKSNRRQNQEITWKSLNEYVKFEQA
jgi:hypothetical protein